jgi:hypothetical protein
VTTAIAAKVAKGASAAPDDRVGGSTFSFTVHPNHPQRERVFRLLSKLRTEVQELWNEVSTYNQAHPPPPDEGVKVSFYLGQTVEAEDREHE